MFTFKKTPMLGIFDSGVGGFSVYKKIRTITSADIVYYGDTLHAPYGNRDDEEIRSFIKDDIRFLQDEGVTHFVNACNSMSVITTDELLLECNINKDHYIDMIRAFDTYASFTRNDHILVLATEATVRSGVYEEVIRKKGGTTFSYAYKDLAFLIENNASQEELLMTIELGISRAIEVSATKIIYGCTHYPLLHDLFLIVQEKLGWKGEFIDPSVYVAQVVKGFALTGGRKFYPYSSKDTPAFIKNVIQIL